MRKLLWACAIVLGLYCPTVHAQESVNPSSENTSWYETTPEEETVDSCREECAEEGADPDECQMDCNTVT